MRSIINRSLGLLLALGLLTVGLGCEKEAQAAKAEPKLREPRPKRTPPTEKEKPKASPAAETDENGEKLPPGVSVRMYRRPMTSGVLEVHSERVANEATATERRSEMKADGWSDWPPMPAPELAETLAYAHPELANCSYLMPVTREPKDITDEPVRTVTCFEDVEEVEAALEREQVLGHQRGQAIPCLELRSIRPADMAKPRIRELRARCRQLGLSFELRGTKLERSREVRKRTKRNRKRTKMVVQ